MIALPALLAIVAAVPCAQQVRFVSTGSEADLYAMRAARAFTKRDKILKFEGGYHGMSDYSLISLAPKRSANFPGAVPDSAGIPRSLRDEMLIAPFNDVAVVESLVREHRDELAGVIVEPFQRIIPPAPGFLQALRRITQENGVPLIFDEVVTGFRLAYGGAQEYYGVVPDLCTLGKVIGGGFPLAAIAGRADIMAHFDRSAVGEHPSGDAVQGVIAIDRRLAACVGRSADIAGRVIGLCNATRIRADRGRRFV